MDEFASLNNCFQLNISIFPIEIQSLGDLWSLVEGKRPGRDKLGHRQNESAPASALWITDGRVRNNPRGHCAKRDEDFRAGQKR